MAAEAEMITDTIEWGELGRPRELWKHRLVYLGDVFLVMCTVLDPPKLFVGLCYIYQWSMVKNKSYWKMAYFSSIKICYQDYHVYPPTSTSWKSKY